MGFKCIFNSNPGGIGRKKTSKRVKIHYRLVITRKNMKKLCNPRLIFCNYFVLSTFLLKISFYISFCNASDQKLDYGRLFSLPQEAIWMMQHLKKNLILCLWDGCKAIWTASPPSHSFCVANTHQEFLDSFSKLSFLNFETRNVSVGFLIQIKQVFKIKHFFLKYDFFKVHLWLCIFLLLF